MTEPRSRRMGLIEADWSKHHEVDLDYASPEQVIELFDKPLRSSMAVELPQD